MSTVPSTRLEIRLQAREKRAWRAKAKKSKLKLSEWIRHRCNGGDTLSLAPVAGVALDGGAKEPTGDAE